MQLISTQQKRQTQNKSRPTGLGKANSFSTALRALRPVDGVEVENNDVNTEAADEVGVVDDVDDKGSGAVIKPI